MTLEKLLNSTAHRPWKIPLTKWRFYQEWNNVIFIHYQVELNVLQQLVPENLEIDLYNGQP